MIYCTLSLCLLQYLLIPAAPPGRSFISILIIFNLCQNSQLLPWPQNLCAGEGTKIIFSSLREKSMFWFILLMIFLCYSVYLF